MDKMLPAHLNEQTLSEKFRLLNVGCGHRIHPDWVNVDFVAVCPGVVEYDLTRGIPFLDHEFDAVYHSHVLEHFPPDAAEALCRECFRVLKPGGVLRVVVPDFESAAREYIRLLDMLSENPSDERAYADRQWILLELLDQSARDHSGGGMWSYLTDPNIINRDYIERRIGIELFDLMQQQRADSLRLTIGLKRHFKQICQKAMTVIFGKHYRYYRIGKFRCSGEVHQWAYDRYALTRLLREIGFVDIKVASVDESRIPGFNGYALDLYNGRPRGESSLFIEANKP